MNYEEFKKVRASYEQEFSRYNARKERLLRGYLKYYHRLEVSGQENIPAGPAILCCNHSGGWDLDILTITHCAHPNRQITPLIAQEWHYINNPWGRYVIGAGLPLWTTGEGLKWDFLDDYLLPEGEHADDLICIFPEGFSPAIKDRHKLHKFFPGVVRMALRYSVPIIPTAMVGFAKASPILKTIPKAKTADDIVPLWPLPFRVKVEFGEPIYLNYGSKLDKHEEYWVANNIVRPRLAELLGRHQRVELAPVDVEMRKP